MKLLCSNCKQPFELSKSVEYLLENGLKPSSGEILCEICESNKP